MKCTLGQVLSHLKSKLRDHGHCPICAVQLGPIGGHAVLGFDISHCQKRRGNVGDLVFPAARTCQTDFVQGLLAQMFGPPSGITASSLEITNEATRCAVDIVALRVACFEVGSTF